MQVYSIQGEWLEGCAKIKICSYLAGHCSDHGWEEMSFPPHNKTLPLLAGGISPCHHMWKHVT
jgi:hypothetical protein